VKIAREDLREALRGRGRTADLRVAVEIAVPQGLHGLGEDAVDLVKVERETLFVEALRPDPDCDLPEVLVGFLGLAQIARESVMGVE